MFSIVAHRKFPYLCFELIHNICQGAEMLRCILRHQRLQQSKGVWQRRKEKQNAQALFVVTEAILLLPMLHLKKLLIRLKNTFRQVVQGLL